MVLAKRYGALAVPALVDHLSSPIAEHRINAHITLMNRLGKAAVMPLLAALQSENTQVRLMVAAELGAIGDARALAALSAIADTDRDESVRENAARARDKLKARFAWAQQMKTADLYVHLAEQYYEGRSGSAPHGRPMVWSWQEGLAAQPVAPYLYLTRLAERAATAALRHDPGSWRAKALLADARKARSTAAALVAKLR
jgi:HEAT repeat protein